MGLFDKLKKGALGETGAVIGNLIQVAGNVTSSTLKKMPQQEQTPSSGAIVYDESLEKLIEMAIANGELSEKNKQILFKRAESQGIDLDEFELVLETKLNEKRNALSANQSHSSKYGEVNKCPACGSFVESFTTRCPECGYEFRGVGAVSSFDALNKKLEEIDNAPMKFSVFSLIDGEDSNSSERIRKKAQMISTFPIPNTKEDLLEFLAMALPLAKKKGNFFSSSSVDMQHNEMVNIWKSKLEQVITKARISMKDDAETLREIEKFASELKIK